ncbi:MAG: LamG domain-containing protein [Kofleriaceae bacterium]
MDARLSLQMGLVGHWPLDDDPSDGATAAAGRDARCVTSCPSPIVGPRSGAFDFDGIDDALVVDDDAAFRLRPGSVALWFRLDGAPPVGEYFGVIGKPWGDLSLNSWEAFLSHPAPNVIELNCCGDSFANPLQFVQIQRTGWVHLAFTWDTSTNIYLDGQRVAGGAFDVQWDDHPLAIGADLSGTVWGRFLDGAIDDVRIYDRVLTEAEIVSLALP